MEFTADETVIADFEAGVGTLTRLGEQRVDTVLVVVEATPKSIEVGLRAVELARERKLNEVVIIANRVRGEDDMERIRAAFPGVEVVPVPDDPAIREADRRGVAPIDHAPDAPAIAAIEALVAQLATPDRARPR